MMAAIARKPVQLAFFGMMALCWFPTSAAADNGVTTRFEVFGFAGVHVLTMRSRTAETAGHYAVSLEYATEGLAKVFVQLSTLAAVNGRTVDGTAEPTWYQNDSVRNGVARHTRVDYQPNGALQAAATPAPADPILPDKARGTVDNLTAYFRLEHQLATSGSCTMTAHIFDGRHAYDLVFTDEGRETLMPSGGQTFSGPAIACRMVRRNWPGVVDPEQDEGAHDGTIWYARLVPGDLLVPVRTRMNTQLGVVDGYLAELHGRGVNLDLLH